MFERCADPLDQAADYAEMLNRDGLARQQAVAPGEKPLVIEGLECCRECGEVIPLARLKALPTVARCAECQQMIDKQRSQYR